MKIVNLNAQFEEAAFAKEAHAYFRDHPEVNSYAKDDPEPGCFLALRWNRHTVLVLRLADDHEPACYDTSQFA